MKNSFWLGVSPYLIALLMSVYHFVVSGRFFDVKDVLHHELFIALFGGVGCGLLLGEYVKP